MESEYFEDNDITIEMDPIDPITIEDDQDLMLIEFCAALSAGDPDYGVARTAWKTLHCTTLPPDRWSMYVQKRTDEGAIALYLADNPDLRLWVAAIATTTVGRLTLLALPGHMYQRITIETLRRMAELLAGLDDVKGSPTIDHIDAQARLFSIRSAALRGLVKAAAEHTWPDGHPDKFLLSRFYSDYSDPRAVYNKTHHNDYFECAMLTEAALNGGGLHMIASEICYHGEWSGIYGISFDCESEDLLCALSSAHNAEGYRGMRSFCRYASRAIVVKQVKGVAQLLAKAEPGVTGDDYCIVAAHQVPKSIYTAPSDAARSLLDRVTTLCVSVPDRYKTVVDAMVKRLESWVPEGIQWPGHEAMAVHRKLVGDYWHVALMALTGGAIDLRSALSCVSHPADNEMFRVMLRGLSLANAQHPTLDSYYKPVSTPDLLVRLRAGLDSIGYDGAEAIHIIDKGLPDSVVGVPRLELTTARLYRFALFAGYFPGKYVFGDNRYICSHPSYRADGPVFSMAGPIEASYTELLFELIRRATITIHDAPWCNVSITLRCLGGISECLGYTGPALRGFAAGDPRIVFMAAAFAFTGDLEVAARRIGMQVSYNTRDQDGVSRKFIACVGTEDKIYAAVRLDSLWSMGTTPSACIGGSFPIAAVIRHNVDEFESYSW